MPRAPDWWMHVTPSLPLTEATVEVEGLPIYYRTGGSGPPLLLLHGGTAIGAQWNPFLDAFGAHYTVIVPDMPGHGRSPCFPPEGFLFSANARVMLGLLDALGVEGARGIGHSSGSGTLMRMATQQPERVEAMVLVSGAHRYSVATQESGGMQSMANWSWESMDRSGQSRFLARHPGGVAQVKAIFAAIRRQVETIEEYDVSSQELARITATTLVIHGDRDGFARAEHAVETYRGIRDAMLWIVPGEGHGPPWSSPRMQATFLDVVHAFFEGTLVE